MPGNRSFGTEDVGLWVGEDGDKVAVDWLVFRSRDVVITEIDTEGVSLRLLDEGEGVDEAMGLGGRGGDKHASNSTPEFVDFDSSASTVEIG